MCQEDHGDSGVDDDMVGLVVGSLQQTEVADQKGNLEEADTDLVDRTTCIIDPRVDDQVLLGAVQKRQAQSIPSFCIEQYASVFHSQFVKIP